MIGGWFGVAPDDGPATGGLAPFAFAFALAAGGADGPATGGGPAGGGGLRSSSTFSFLTGWPAGALMSSETRRLTPTPPGSLGPAGAFGGGAEGAKTGIEIGWAIEWLAAVEADARMTGGGPAERNVAGSTCAKLISGDSPTN